jgi:hypothetical protein
MIKSLLETAIGGMVQGKHLRAYPLSPSVPSSNAHRYTHKFINYVEYTSPIITSCYPALVLFEKANDIDWIHFCNRELTEISKGAIMG